MAKLGDWIQRVQGQEELNGRAWFSKSCAYQEVITHINRANLGVGKENELFYRI